MPHAITPKPPAPAAPREPWRIPEAAVTRAPTRDRRPRLDPRGEVPETLRARIAPGAWRRPEELVLSAREPIAPGKGALETWEAQLVETPHPALYFEHVGERAGGGAMVWLDGLDEDALYLVELHLSVLEGAIEIGVSDMSCTRSPAQGLDHHARVLLDRPSRGAALLTLRPVDVRDWAIYEVRVRRLS